MTMVFCVVSSWTTPSITKRVSGDSEFGSFLPSARFRRRTDSPQAAPTPRMTATESVAILISHINVRAESLPTGRALRFQVRGQANLTEGQRERWVDVKLRACIKFPGAARSCLLLYC
jgi:hypothetical protein